jgi:RNA polymerase sigma-70 factor (ECF subfamily)
LAKFSATEQFYEWVWPHRAVVLRAAQIQTGNAAEAEDLAQETLLKAFKAIGSFKAGTNVKAWLMTILRNTRIDRLRTAAGSAKHASLDELSVDPQSPAMAEETDPSAWNNPAEMLAEFADAEVIAALNQISEDLRWTLLLVDVEQMDHRQAAEILDVPVGTVKSRVHRGHAALRTALLPLARDRRLVDG